MSDWVWLAVTVLAIVALIAVIVLALIAERRLP